MQFGQNFDKKNSDEPWLKFDKYWSKFGSKFTSAQSKIKENLLLLNCKDGDKSALAILGLFLRKKRLKSSLVIWFLR